MILRTPFHLPRLLSPPNLRHTSRSTPPHLTRSDRQLTNPPKPPKSTPPPPHLKPPRKRPSLLQSLIPYLTGLPAVVFATLNLFFCYHLLTTYVGSITTCLGPSMVPTLSVKGDWVYISRWYRRGRGIKVGDCVECEHPVIIGMGVVKRVVGMPGDFVTTGGWGGGGGRGSEMMIQVPEGHCWVLGDNLAESRDSRVYGPIPLALVRGKVVAKVLPFGERMWVRNNLERVVEDG